MKTYNNKLIFVILFSIAIRTIYLIYNIYIVELDPYWQWQARQAILIALSEFGNLQISPDIEKYYRTTLDESMSAWHLNERGLVVLYFLVKKILGFVNYPAIQIIHLFVDVLMTFFVFSIGRQLGGDKVAFYSGLTYALFVPQIFMMANPAYDFWLTCAFVASAWAIISVVSRSDDNLRHRSTAGFIIAAGIFIYIGYEFRATLVFYGIALALWYLFVETVDNRSLRLSTAVWGRFSAMAAAGIAVIVVCSSVNFMVRDQFSPVRTTLGHHFWNGVGQFENTFGLIDDDGSVVKFYERESGNATPPNVLDFKYNRWLVKRASQFVVGDPASYLSMVVRRAGWIFFPYKMPFEVVADYNSHSGTSQQKDLISKRVLLFNQHGRFSIETITTILFLDPGYMISAMMRIIFAVALFIGYLWCFILPGGRRLAAIGILPVVYTAVTLAPIYATPVVIASAHAAAVPVAVLGWSKFAEKCREFLLNRTPQ
jgi:hypothetical protein